MAAEVELPFEVTDDVDFTTVVVLLVDPPVLLPPPPPETVALLVAVAEELPWATLEGRPAATVGPGMVYVSGLV